VARSDALADGGRMRRLALTSACAVLLLSGPSNAAPTHSAPMPSAPMPVAPATTYSAPLAGQLVVLRGFQPPPTPYAAGHRGVDLATSPGAEVLAAGNGRVHFAGSVAGRGVVVVVHPDGISTEYEPVRPLVAPGAAVARGQPIGRVLGAHGSCSPQRCLHWGARRAGAYFDPLSLLRPLGPVRLLPWAN
jgi:murein DD-endopeptidase MepM/ murein hydrolase activator NlpD